MKDDDKVTFHQQFYSFIFAYLTGITPLNTQLLLELYNRNLITEKSGLSSVEYNNIKERFILKFSNGDVEEADYLVDASGLGYDIREKIPHFPLLSNLVEKGLLVPKRFGGIQLSDKGQVINRDNKLQENFFCIGPTASYCQPTPTPYASFIAIKAVQEALSASVFNKSWQKRNAAL